MTFKKIVRVIAYIAIFLTPIFPLIVANSFFFPFITGKAFYFRIVVEIAFAAWVILAFLDAKYRPKLTPLSIGITVFALVTLVADLLGVNPLRSLWSNFERMEGWITIIHLWAFFITVTHLFGSDEQGRRIWHRWFNVSTPVALIVAIYGIAQLAGWTEIHQGGVRVDATLGNAAYMAVYMLFHVFICAYLFFVAKRKQIANASFLVWAYPILAVLFGFLVFETATRGTILGLVGGIMLALFLYAVCGRNEPQKYRSIAGGIIIAIILLGVVFWLNRGAAFIQKNEVLNRLANISWNDASGQARQFIWPMALKGAIERPIFGWGQENFNYIFNAHYDAHMWGQEQWFDRAHSVFLDWLTASGFVGLLAYLALYVLFLMAIWKSSLSVSEKSVLTGLLAAYAIHNAFVFDNLASYVIFFGLLGFASSLSKPASPEWMGTEPVRSDAVEYIVAPIVILALVAVFYFFDYRPIQANQDLIAGLQTCTGQGADVTPFMKALGVNVYVANQEIREQTLSCATSVISNGLPQQVQQAFYGLAASSVQAQINATPKDARIYALAGTFLNQIDQPQQALPVLQKAHELSPDKQAIDFQLASAYINTDDSADAVALLEKAYKSDPEYTEARNAYANALVFAGQEAKAHELFGNDPAVFQTMQMAQIYMSLKKYSQAIAIYEKLAAADPSNVQLVASYAQAQFSAGRISDAIKTLRSVETSHPEYKDRIEATIKQIQQTPAQ